MIHISGRLRIFRTPLARLRQLSSASAPSIDYYSEVTDAGCIQYGDYKRIASNSLVRREYVVPEKVCDLLPGEWVWLRGRISSVRVKGNVCFIVLRFKSLYTLQICHFRDKKDPLSRDLIKFMSGVPVESVVDACGEIKNADVKSCSIKHIELALSKLLVVSRAPPVLPFSVEDASRSEDDIRESHAHSSRPFPGVSQDTRLNNRWLDLRVPANNAIMRIKGGISMLFREALVAEGFTEIVTPKLLSGQSEGGSDVFTTSYFGNPACLAQSPQLYKQMALSADFGRVFEIGPVFRAENSNTRRHLCEYTGLDLEMEIFSHYNEVLDVLHRLFRYIFAGLEERFAFELSVIRRQFPSEPALITEDPIIIHWENAMDMLVDAGVNPNRNGDISGQEELLLGKIVKDKYGTDFFALDQYPSAVRPFYTMPNPENCMASNSYDLFIRGQEICSGGQRCHDPVMLQKAVTKKGLDPNTLKFYIDSFKHGISPHGGGGIGLERVVFLYLGLENIRKASMFPRYPGRCSP